MQPLSDRLKDNADLVAKLSSTSKDRATSSAVRLSEKLGLIPDEADLATYLVDIESDLLSLAFNLRRVFDLIGLKANEPADEDNSIEEPHLPNLETAKGFRTAMIKLVHHVLLHTKHDDHNNRITAVISECDRGKFTEIELASFCESAKTHMKNIGA